MVAGVGTSTHSSFPLSSPSARTISSRTISHAISRAVRDFGSGRYVDPSGIREMTLRVAGASLSQNFKNSAFSSIVPLTLLPRTCVRARSGHTRRNNGESQSGRSSVKI